MLLSIDSPALTAFWQFTETKSLISYANRYCFVKARAGTFAMLRFVGTDAVNSPQVRVTDSPHRNVSHTPHKTAAPMHSFQPPNDNDIVFYPSGGHFNKFRREGYLRELLDHHFEGWAATRNKKDYILNVILPKVGTSYFVDKSGEVSVLQKESAAEKMRYQLDYTKKDRAGKKRKSDASTAFPLADSQSISQKTSLQPSKAVSVPRTTTATNQTVTEAVATAKRASNVLQQHLVMDPIPFEIATTTGAVAAPAEIVDAFHTMKESLDRLLICNEKIYFRLFQELNKISDKLDDSSTQRGEEENS